MKPKHNKNPGKTRKLPVLKSPIIDKESTEFFKNLRIASKMSPKMCLLHTFETIP